MTSQTEVKKIFQKLILYGLNWSFVCSVNERPSFFGIYSTKEKKKDYIENMTVLWEIIDYLNESLSFHTTSQRDIRFSNQKFYTLHIAFY